MTDQYLGEIRMFGGNFAPTGWAFCQGQLLAIQQFTALFSLLGTYYGGNGTSNFALPDLRGRAPMSMGTSSDPFLGDVVIGQADGTETVSLVTTEMPAHTHLWPVETGPNSAGTEKGGTPTEPLANGPVSYGTVAANTSLSPTTVGTGGASLPHANMMPYVAINFIIALNGIFPPRP
jgi:microcystin-dependent protein